MRGGNNISFDNDLTSRQWKLHNYLLHSSKDTYISKEIICEALYQEYPRHLELLNGVSQHNSSVFADLRKDFRAINRSEITQHLFVSSKYGYKVANENEAAYYIQHKYNNTLKTLKLISNMKNKISKDGQTRLVFNTESYIIEAFK
jgi:hypothetical protein